MSDQEPVRRRTRRRPVPDDYAVAKIFLWDQEVGAVAEDATGEITFEYTPAFRRSGLEISPVHLPLATEGPRTFPELRRTESFAGLPGVLADCLPDAFGTTAIRAYFDRVKRPNQALSPVQKLLYLGNRAMGALEFRPAIERRTRAADDALEIRALWEDARRLVDGDPHIAIPEMIRVSASAGGARAKALVLWNPALTRLKSAFAPRKAGDEHWLLKFDGVSDGGGGPVARKQDAPGPYGRTEYAYAQMARRAGIEMPETHLLHERGYAHFMVRRFDRVGDARLHLHSLGGLLHSDYRQPGVSSYEDYFRAIRDLGMDQPDIEQAYRRMVFNLAARNQDDHVKNLAFLMDEHGTWRLAPAFDVTWAVGSNWTRTHQMRANGKVEDFSRDDLLTIGGQFDVRRDGADIIADVESALATWETEARAVELDDAWITQLRAHFRRFV
ncbi:MAG TPA: type II toxin-antitoxin system HipA family toxin [Gemmatimonadaceae bacterium]